MKAFFFSLLFIVIHFSTYSQDSGSNSIEIIPDSSNQFACFRITRIKEKVYSLKFVNDRNKTIYSTKIKATTTPIEVFLPWANEAPGAYKAILKNKREEIVLLFLKKEKLPTTIITETNR